MDGYPNDEIQAASFIADIGKPTVVLCLELSDEVMMSRLRSRGNFDDQLATIEKRVVQWNEKTKPVAASFNAFVINADRPALDIFADIEKALN